MLMRGAIVAALLLALLASSCGGGENGATATRTVDLSTLTVEQVYARIAQGMTRGGQVLHTRMQVGTEQGTEGERELLPYYTTDLWIDEASHALRLEYRLDPDVDSYDLATTATLVVAGPYLYVPDDPDEALRSDVEDFCPQNDDPLISYLLECGGVQLRQESAATTARFDANAEYDGHPAVALVFDVNGAVFKGTFTTYIDPATFLPIARTAEPVGRSFPRSVVEYENEFVDAASLDQSLFDPHSIGYGAEDEQAKVNAIAQGVPVWWIGDEFKPASPWGELVLTRINLAEVDPWGSDGHLVYETPDGLEGADILLWTPAHFDAFMKSEDGAVLSDPLCVTRTTLKTDQGDDDLYAIPWPEPPVNTSPQTPEEACPIRIVNAVLQGWSYVAIVRMEDVVVDVRVPEPAGRAYASEDGIRVLVNALRARPAVAPGAPVATPIPTWTPVPPPPTTPVFITVLPAVTATPPR